MAYGCGGSNGQFVRLARYDNKKECLDTFPFPFPSRAFNFFGAELFLSILHYLLNPKGNSGDGFVFVHLCSFA